MSVRRKNNEKKRGMALIAFALMACALVPIVGLSVDVGIMYSVKTKLSMAVDAGALAGARSLSQGVNSAAQTASAQATAKNYIRANFPAGYFLTTNLQTPDPAVDTSVANVRSISVLATVVVPTYFLRWFTSTIPPVFDADSVTVAASAQAVRRDVNVMMVVDRSGSLERSGSCGAVRGAAINFQDKFAEGRDNLGLITFASSAFVDFPMGNNFKSAAPNIATELSGLVCDGATSSAMGLWMGYRQLATLNQPGALNVILFFTDGQPTGITANYEILPGSTCTDHNPKLAVYNVSTDNSAAGGLFAMSVGQQPLAGDLVMAPNSANCTYASSWPNPSLWWGWQDVSSIPTVDYYGNSTESGYYPVPQHRFGGIDPSHPTSVTAAAVNAADDAGLRIRHGVAAGGGLAAIPNVVIFSIGLGNSAIGPPADDFLRRVSNDPAATNYESTYPTGLFVSAPTSADLADAFAKIASEILRLAK